MVFLPLPDALARWEEAGLDTSPLRAGLDAMAVRYRALGLTGFLPLDRVTLGVRSTRPDAFGGFHHPNQGYRHLQMRALITTYGPLTTGYPHQPALACLDLLRAYAHDCLHYGSHRTYRLHLGRLARTQYGLNYRHPGGSTYSSRDAADTLTTRNLGVVMEGACDREARTITRDVARRICLPELVGIDRYAYLDVTGQLDATDGEHLDTQSLDAEAATYLDAMAKYEDGVNTRYAAFLAEIGQDEADDLHTVLLAAMISGRLAPLCAWLDARHGPGTFPALFQSPTYLTAHA